MPHVDYTLNAWTVGVTVGGWLAAALVIAWKLGSWTAAVNGLKDQVRGLAERMDDHEEHDDKRFDGLTAQVHAVQIEQARISGRPIHVNPGRR